MVWQVVHTPLWMMWITSLEVLLIGSWGVDKLVGKSVDHAAGSPPVAVDSVDNPGCG